MSKILVIFQKLFILQLFLSRTVLSQSGDFIFKGFKGHGDDITLNGVSQIEKNGILKLTDDTPRQLGHAFYKDRIFFKNSSNGKVSSFSTAFAFAIVPEYERLGGHGMAFIISATKELKGALPNQYLGMVNQNNLGNLSNHFLAVEFDIVQDLELHDISDNHVGIDINSVISNASVNASYFPQGSLEKQGINLKSGKTIQAWIDYDSNENELNVTLSLSSSKSRSSILSFQVDLAPFFQDYMYIGFSASTGLLSGSHYVFGWSFKTNGIAESLDLSSFPSLTSRKRKSLGLVLGTSISAAAFVVLAVLLVMYIVKKFRNMDVIETWEYDIGPHRFSYKELKKATRDFGETELLGFGGFGRVYKGTLPKTGIQVAVKRISNESKQGLREFVSEIASMGRLRHRNLVQLVGWCRQGDDLLLVYDFMPNGSLDKHLFNEPKMILSWPQRFKIIRDVASGLCYLHEGWEQTVIHRDIKAGNVMLDSALNGKLGDFGLAKLHEHGANATTTRVVGTLGYIAPELTKTGKPTTSSDVFAFGALLLEVVCGRRPIEPKALPEELVLLDWTWDKWEKGAILEVVDPKLGGEYDEMEVLVVLKLGIMCSNNSPSQRPSMRQVVRYLEGESVLPDVVLPPDQYDGKKDPSGEIKEFINSFSESTWSSGEFGHREYLLPNSTTSLVITGQEEGR